MPISLTPHAQEAKPQRESFMLKSMLVISALFFGTMVLVNAEFHFSTPAHSLSEAEALRLTER